jgi:hypothetical protein
MLCRSAENLPKSAFPGNEGVFFAALEEFWLGVIKPAFPGDLGVPNSI